MEGSGAVLAFSGVTLENREKYVRISSRPDLDLKKKLVKCYIWSMALYGAET